MAAKKPMKGCKADELKEIPIPCALSFKIDGIRGMAYDGAANSTSGVPLRNKQIQREFAIVSNLIEGLDGEIIDGNPNDANVMQASYTAAMNGDAVTEFTYWVFDDFTDVNLPFNQRYANYQARVKEANRQLEEAGYRPFLRAVEYREINSMEEYNAMKEEAAQLGYEGLYGKSWHGLYKHGRATPKQAWVWKDKPWTDEEGMVHEVVEMMGNENEAMEDEFGRTKRSTSSSGLVPKGYAGSLVVTNPAYKDKDGNQIPFRVSLGSMTMEERKAMWENRSEYPGKLATYKFFNFGVVDVPRSAIFKNWRDASDLTDF